MKRQMAILLTLLMLVSTAVASDGSSSNAAAQWNPRMKCKLEFPRFFVPVNGLATWVREPAAPVCKGPVSFIGDWPSRPPDSSGRDSVPITARYGVDWDGFYLGYELTAEAPLALHGRTRLAITDLRNVSVRYTDDQIEADARKNIPVSDLIELLRNPTNQVPDHYCIIIPGGEEIRFSTPLKALMFRGAEARAPLLAALDEPGIRNEVVLALGAVGDENTIPELISRYPRGPIATNDPAAALTRVCFSFALCWLTGQPVDRSRWGTDQDPNNAQKWRDWWAAHKKTFRVPLIKPGGTWVPPYPLLAADHIRRIRTMFAEHGYDGFDYE